VVEYKQSHHPRLSPRRRQASRGPSRIRIGQTPAGEVATATHYGDDYTQMVPVYRALEQWCASNGRRPVGVNWEVYGDPAEDPAQTRTDIYFLLKPMAG
jgi:effector-binding domain-containing protein